MKKRYDILITFFFIILPFVCLMIALLKDVLPLDNIQYIAKICWWVVCILWLLPAIALFIYMQIQENRSNEKQKSLLIEIENWKCPICNEYIGILDHGSFFHYKAFQGCSKDWFYHDKSQWPKKYKNCKDEVLFIPCLKCKGYFYIHEDQTILEIQKN